MALAAAMPLAEAIARLAALRVPGGRPAPVYLRLIRAFEAGDLASAREQQWKSVRLIRTLATLGYMGAAKAVMGMLGVDVGPPRLPNTALEPAQSVTLRRELEALGFFEGRAA